MNLSQQIKQYADYEDTHSAPISLNAHALWKQVAELEAELADCKAMGKDVCKDRSEIKAERDRLRETIEILKQALDNAHKDKAVF